MQIEISLPDVAADVPTFAVARVSEPLRCPVLGQPLQRAVSQLIAGLHVVLVHRGADGDLRTYGRADLVRAAVGLDLERQLWAPFELPERPADDDDAFELLAA